MANLAPQPAAFAAVFAFAGSLLAQAPVITVGGLNPNYDDLPLAVAQAQPGSILQVRPGKYTGFTTNKPLCVHLLFGDGRGIVRPAPGSNYAITVTGLAAADRFRLVGGDSVVEAGALGAIRIVNCAGVVSIEGVAVAAGTGTAIDVQNAPAVVLQKCNLSGTPALQLQTGTVVGNSTDFSSPSGIAVAAYQGVLDFALGSFAGHELPAIQVTSSAIRLAGGGSTPIAVTGSPAWPTPAFQAVSSQVQWDPSRFSLAPAQGAPGLLAYGGQVTATELPVLTAQGGPPGGGGFLALTSVTPRPGMVVLGPIVPPTHFGLAGVYVNLAQPYALAAVGIVGPAGLVLAFSIPPSAALLGDTSCLQGVTFQPDGSIAGLSGPALLTVI